MLRLNERVRNIKELGFKHIYTIFPCVFKRNLPSFIYDAEKSAREKGAEDYENPSVELVSIQKVGFVKYLVVWKVQGYRKQQI